ncbi:MULTISPECIES: DUF5134 domain-containing protein [Mycobacteriaceae]|uniref:DUF5134 domain-containing protein n=1 Tax=Mycolicibacterium parafortuitum TaxID=39692 RepID=A0ACC6MDQ6_MYCPF|nr:MULTISPECIES: DUF5134 domain-containing protein [Mycobacteriaceae]MDZ5085091.1 DUF5134 domain-containing protein [Mycolicibacterium parafortuitum]GFM20951.1 uncharacterized protein PO1_contig-096-85 [Mycobacterium sp. PO1]GFM22085.1 uncharacterized protein PO2_contig-005-35 [Mycobacterium sp. PO2]
MIDDLLLRGVVTALFVATAVMFAIASWVHRRTAGYVVSGALHIVMAVAMIAMSWPQSAALPTTGPMVFFLLATVYFVIVVFAQAGHRMANAYHAAMMLAMAWMYAVMSGDLAPAPAEGSVPAGGHGGHHHGGHAMADVDMASPSAATPPFVTGLNWVFTVGFAIAAVVWLYVYFASRRGEPARPTTRFFGIAGQVTMAAGMAIMFAVMR